MTKRRLGGYALPLAIIAAGFVFAVAILGFDFFSTSSSSAAATINWTEPIGVGFAVPACSSSASVLGTCVSGAPEIRLSIDNCSDHINPSPVTWTFYVSGIEGDTSQGYVRGNSPCNQGTGIQIRWSRSVQRVVTQSGNPNPQAPLSNHVYAWRTNTLSGIPNGGVLRATPNCTLPPTALLSGNPLNIIAGNSSTLTWGSSNATSCTIDNGVGTGGAPNGNVSVSPVNTTTYTLTCTGAGGLANDSETITVSQPAPSPTASLTANPETITQGNPSTLTWSSTNSTSCSIDQGVGTVCSSAGTCDAGGNRTVSPSSTTNYTLTCTSPGGSDNDQVSVTVNPSPLPSTLSVALAANPPSGNSPLPVTLQATVSGTAVGTVNYSFWWDCSNSTSNLATAISACGALPADSAPGDNACTTNTVGGKCDGVLNTSQTTSHTYSVGIYQPKVIVERETAAAEDRGSVTVSPPSAGLTCSPASQTVWLQEHVTINASGGSGTYNWSAPGGIPVSPNGSSSFTVRYEQSGSKTVTLNDGAGSVQCSVIVSPPPACELLPQAGRILAGFSGDRGIVSASTLANSRKGPVSAAIPVGRYRMTFNYWDNHSRRPPEVQPNEQWFLRLNAGAVEVALTSATSDLPDLVDGPISEIVESDFNITQNLTSVTASHAAYPDPNFNSIHPLCVAFDPVTTAPPPLPACSDGVDNDNDGKIDHSSVSSGNPDPGCSSPNDNSEADPPVFCESPPGSPPGTQCP